VNARFRTFLDSRHSRPTRYNTRSYKPSFYHTLRIVPGFDSKLFLVRSVGSRDPKTSLPISFHSPLSIDSNFALCRLRICAPRVSSLGSSKASALLHGFEICRLGFDFEVTIRVPPLNCVDFIWFPFRRMSRVGFLWVFFVARGFWVCMFVCPLKMFLGWVSYMAVGRNPLIEWN
jgi:hypothetical protein